MLDAEARLAQAQIDLTVASRNLRYARTKSLQLWTARRKANGNG